MPVYDPLKPKSPEAATLWAYGLLLADSEIFQELVEKENATEAREKIVVGAGAKPWDEDKYTEDELALLFCEARIMWELSDSHVTARDDGGPEPLETGTFYQLIRRYVRESERDLIEVDGGLDFWFYDMIAGIETEVMTLMEQRECPRLLNVQRVGGPAISEWDTEAAQGPYLWAQHAISWGDLIEV